MDTIRIESGTVVQGRVRNFVKGKVGLKDDWHLEFVPSEITAEIRNVAGPAVITCQEHGLNEATCVIRQVTIPEGILIVQRSG